MVGPQPRRSQPRLPPKLVVAKVALTGGTGFLGSNIAEVLGTAGHDVLVLTRATPTMAVPWNYEVLDTSDSGAVASAIADCDALVHTAIANDFQNLDAETADRTAVIVTQVRAKDFTEGGAFWQVGVPEVSPRASVTAARAAMDEGLRAQRPGI